MAQNWYRVDEKENAVDFIESAARHYSGNDPHRWKWLTISLHGALYGFAVLAIQGTNYERVTRSERVVNNPKAAQLRQGVHPRLYLISLGEALRRCQNEEFMLQRSGSQTLKISDAESRAAKQLSDTFRNNFVHFIPKSWSIDVSGFPEIVAHTCRLIDFLVFSSGNVMLTPEQGQRVRTALQTLSGK